MLRVNIIARSILSKVVQKNTFAFCLNKAMLDPSKHTTMNHSPHNCFIDLYDIGQYPDLPHIGSIPARTYQPAVITIIAKNLSQRYNIELTDADIMAHETKSWERLLNKSIKSADSLSDVLPTIMNELALNIFVKESRWTWVKEQKQRLTYTNKFMSIYQPKTIGEFLESYNASIEQLVLISNLGFDPNIRQATSTLEKHLISEMDSQAVGITDLNKIQGENDTFINRVMKLLHK